MRTKLARVLAVWLAVLTAFAALTALVAPAAHADTASEEDLFLSLTNQLRSSLGIQTLTPQAQLTSVARNWSAQMAAAGGISHNPALTSQAPSNWTELGENVGTGGTVEAIQTAFINSPHHYENLANGAYNFVGIGVVHGSNGAIYVTVDFMAAKASAGGGGGGGSAAPAPARTTAPRTTAAPKAAAPATPRATTPATAAPVTAPASTTPTIPAQSAPTPAAPKDSPALRQVLSQLRAVDS